MSVLEEMGDALARDVIAAMEELGDDRFYDKVSKVLLDASPTMQEAFLTAFRVRVAEKRGRAFIEAALKAKREGREGPRVVMD
ncbi:hypothetical protein [Cypionkella sp.]|jgi:hypothetical protein|uniref:hypothetical protein n=1 Tax=Cypionkella sp. TaxID=2811411 RepID=UPI00375029EF